MAVQTITYDNKVALNVNPDIANTNKVTDNDMNEIKSVVNNNANNIGDLSNLTTPTTTNLVGAINSIVESGSNANGSYIKYADGTMICTKLVTATTRISTAFGSLYETSSAVQFGDFAIPFVSNPFVIGNCTGRTALLEAFQGLSTTSWGRTWLMRPSADTSDNEYNINLFAIGKWK